MKIYKYIQILSLDVVAGACVAALYLAELMRVAIDAPSVLSLAIAVWLIYTADHLWDARKNLEPSTVRHKFHKEHFISLTVAWSLIALCGLLILFFVPIQILQYGGGMVAIVFGYFTLVHFYKKPIIFKELLVASLYSFGITIPVLSYLNNGHGLVLAMLVGVYFIIALINLFIFSLYEENEDKQDGHSSIVIQLGSDLIMKLTKVLWVVGIIFAIYVQFHLDQKLYVFVVMFAGVGAILFNLERFRNNNWYRLVGDGIFLTPLVPLLI